MRTFPKRILVVLFCVLGGLTSAAVAGPLVVTTTADDPDLSPNDGVCLDINGKCSLRAAIEEATATGSSGPINFNIPSSDPNCDATTHVCTISPGSALPTITTYSLLIDGYSQPGTSSNSNNFTQGDNAVLLIELNGANAGAGANGLTIQGQSCTVKGLVINRFNGAGIFIDGAYSDVIAGNFIGTSADGTTALGNGVGIVLSNSQFSTIGSVTADGRNVISGNTGDGVQLTGGMYRTDVTGNLIGTKANGSEKL